MVGRDRRMRRPVATALWTVYPTITTLGRETAHRAVATEFWSRQRLGFDSKFDQSDWHGAFRCGFSGL
jgi:hypothetical protein